MNHIAKAEQSLRFTPQPRIRFEIALLQLAHIDSTADISILINELREIKKKGLSELHTSSVVSDNLISKEKSVEYSEIKNDTIEQKHKRTLNVEQFMNEWNNFISSEEVRELGFKLHSVIPELNGRIIKLTAASEFEKEYMERKSESLELLVENMYDLIIKFEFEYKIKENSKASVPEMTFQNNLNKSSTSILKTINNSSDPNLHPVEKILIKDFGAELLMDYSKEA
jgi:hypothetical protein